MNIRGKYGTVESFSTLIKEETDFIVEDENVILMLEEKEKEGLQVYPCSNIQVIKDYNAEILYYKHDIFLATYSMGKELSVLYNDFLSLLPYFEKYWYVRQNYIELLNMFSIGILFDIERERFDKLVGIAKANNLNDCIYDYLIDAKIQRNHIDSDNFIYKLPYSSIKDIVSIAQLSKDEAINRLKKYLTKEWYRGHSSEGWYNIHKTNIGSFSGYWSFESGALVKILGLDDSTLKDCPYYPYDMVHLLDNK